MIKISQAIVVEGRYDKNTLSQIVDAPIFETSGFHIMKDKATQALLRRVAMERGLIVFTDSDGGGFVIRLNICFMLTSRIFTARKSGNLPREKKESWAWKE